MSCPFSTLEILPATTRSHALWIDTEHIKLRKGGFAVLLKGELGHEVSMD